MSRSPWDPSPDPNAQDALADALTGLVARARALRGAVEAAAPTVPPRAVSTPPHALDLAVLGLLSLCARVEALFGAVRSARASAVPPPPSPAPGSLLR
jgi:hypothetical protein